MSQIKQTFNQIIYGYEPNEFLPIYVNGRAINKGEFVRYKLVRAIKHRSLL